MRAGFGAAVVSPPCQGRPTLAKASHYGEKRRLITAIVILMGGGIGRPGQPAARRDSPAFEASSREVVDERLRWAREQGMEIENDPKEYDYRPGYYAGFFYDPDGIKLEIVHVP